MDDSTGAKSEALRQCGAFNPRPHDVVDDLFLQDEFFDPHDLVQVKYEMLRRVLLEGETVVQTARQFGFSRPAFYQARSALQQGGLPALVPKRRGPKGAHKLTAEVVEFIEQQRVLDEAMRAGTLSQMVLKKFGLSIHARSIERALSRRRKKGR